MNLTCQKVDKNEKFAEYVESITWPFEKAKNIFGTRQIPDKE